MGSAPDEARSRTVTLEVSPGGVWWTTNGAQRPSHTPRSASVLRRRGTAFVRTVKGPPGAPTVVLLHGWAATAGLNWHQAFEPLSRYFRVIAPDLHGHGRGVRSRRPFRLADVADDVAETLDILDAAPAIAVGYSMGGPVAQLLWRRHPESVTGLVLTATGADFVRGNRERYALAALAQILAGTRAPRARCAGYPPAWPAGCSAPVPRGRRTSR